eukprot:COSAG01_NODE_3880_length_5592_cov_25.973603_2_plen_94_part_00
MNALVSRRVCNMTDIATKTAAGDDLVEASWRKKDAHRLRGLEDHHNWKLVADQLGRLAEEVKGNKERLAALEESHKASIAEITASIQSQHRQQ